LLDFLTNEEDEDGVEKKLASLIHYYPRLIAFIGYFPAIWRCIEIIVLIILIPLLHTVEV